MMKLTYRGEDYENDIALAGGGIEMSHSALGETLAADSAVVPVTTGGSATRIVAADQGPNDFLLSSDGKILCASSKPLPIFKENEIGLIYFNNALLAKMYATDVDDTTRKSIDLKFYSAIYQLTKTDHLGGMYSGDTVGNVLSEIIGGTFAYTVDEDIAAIAIDAGYLKKDSRRNNLQKLLMAYTIAVRNNADGSPRFTQLTDVTAGTFDESRMYQGGSVSDEAPVTGIQVTEYTYVESTEEETLYSDSLVGTQTIHFSEPHHTLSIVNGTIDAQGANYCTFAGTGAVVITGRKYIEITGIVTHGTPPTGTPADYVKYIENNTLITGINSAAIAENFYDYYTKTTVIQRSIMVGTERPGDVVNVTHPFTGESHPAYLMSMSMEFGGAILKAAADFLVGYVPPGATAGFTNYVVLTGSGSWTVPAGVTLIRSILVEPGQGGQGGQGGGRPALYVHAGVGGIHGAAGQSGKILETNLTVTPGQIIAFNAPPGSIGSAGSAGLTSGTGAAVAASSAALPSPTTFGALTTDAGRAYPYGYSEPKSGLIFAMSGIDGADGGDGAGDGHTAESVTFNEQTWTGGLNYLSQAGGGGAAVGANGGDGTLAGGVNRGGDGANANGGADATHYGEGGHGGHGGGGGGGVADTAITDTVGNGGNGGGGGDGNPGVIVIYY